MSWEPSSSSTDLQKTTRSPPEKEGSPPPSPAKPVHRSSASRCPEDPGALDSTGLEGIIGLCLPPPAQCGQEAIQPVNSAWGGDPTTLWVKILLPQQAGFYLVTQHMTPLGGASRSQLLTTIPLTLVLRGKCSLVILKRI